MPLQVPPSGPGLPNLLSALQTGGAPVGNLGKGGLPLLEGLGAQQDFLRGASPAELSQVSPLGALPSAPGLDPTIQALIIQLLAQGGGGGVPQGLPQPSLPAQALGGLPV